jgi:molybdopterin converting factor small subunit
MKLTVQYHAMLREEKGLPEEQVEYAGPDPRGLYQELGLSLAPEHLKVAINDEMADWDAPLKDGDVVIFIPPVAGG